MSYIPRYTCTCRFFQDYICFPNLNSRIYLFRMWMFGFVTLFYIFFLNKIFGQKFCCVIFVIFYDIFLCFFSYNLVGQNFGRHRCITLQQYVSIGFVKLFTFIFVGIFFSLFSHIFEDFYTDNFCPFLSTPFQNFWKKYFFETFQSPYQLCSETQKSWISEIFFFEKKDNLAVFIFGHF